MIFVEDDRMSEIINNVSQERQDKLKKLIHRLHNGEDQATVEAEFKADFAYVTGAEIAQMEYNLVQEGVSIEEIQNLCDIHASLFQGSIQQMHDNVLTINPLTEFEEENEAFRFVVSAAQAFRKQDLNTLQVVKAQLGQYLSELKAIEDHYARKENILFPYLEKGGDFVISKVMWGVDNKIRKAIREADKALEGDNLKAIIKTFDQAVTMIDDMITKENRVLFPMLRDKLTENQFKEIARSLRDEGASSYQEPQTDTQIPTDLPEEVMAMSMGFLNLSQMDAIFNALPFDLTFVNADNKVQYVSQGKDRIFDRPFSVIGRSVDLCHPPQSVHVVMQIVDDLRAGRKDHEDFWINFKGRMVYIRYYAVRDKAGTFLGTLEVTQDIGPIRDLHGEKRLMS
jgi:uncharacterized protein